MSATFTHTIRGTAARQTFHHHAGTKLNKVHAINNPDQPIRDCASAKTVCGMTIRVEEDTRVYIPTYNCQKATETSKVTCKDCCKVLGI